MNPDELDTHLTGQIELETKVTGVSYTVTATFERVMGNAAYAKIRLTSVKCGATEILPSVKHPLLTMLQNAVCQELERPKS